MGRAIYVSSVNGDDANSGYAPEKAFRSLRKVNQIGDTAGRSDSSGERIGICRRVSASVQRWYKGGTGCGRCVRRRCAAAHRDGRKRDLVSELWRTSGQCSTYLERLSVLSGSFIRCRIHFHPESGNYKQPMRPK